jgi:hypothetical protein
MPTSARRLLPARRCLALAVLAVLGASAAAAVAPAADAARPSALWYRIEMQGHGAIEARLQGRDGITVQRNEQRWTWRSAHAVILRRKCTRPASGPGQVFVTGPAGVCDRRRRPRDLFHDAGFAAEGTGQITFHQTSDDRPASAPVPGQTDYPYHCTPYRHTLVQVLPHRFYGRLYADPASNGLRMSLDNYVLYRRGQLNPSDGFQEDRIAQACTNVETGDVISRPGVSRRSGGTGFPLGRGEMERALRFRLGSAWGRTFSHTRTYRKVHPAPNDIVETYRYTVTFRLCPGGGRRARGC